MWITKEGYSKINLDDVFRITKAETVEKISIKFEYRGTSERWSKFSFPTKEERDDYWDALNTLLDIKEIEPDIIGKLK